MLDHLQIQMPNTFSPISSELERIKRLPTLVVSAMCWIFAILFGVWALPHTVFIRHACMIIGCILGLYVIAYLWRNNFLKMQVNAIPIFLILALFFWVFIHLLWIGKEPQLQLIEFKRIWKKIIICSPFALGLGLGIRYVIEAGDEKQVKKLWRIIYFAFGLPAFMYFGKLILTNYFAPENLPNYFVLSEQWNSPSGMPKYFYVFFCLPFLAVTLGVISRATTESSLILKDYLLYFLVLPVSPLIFFLESTRNGILYSAVILFIALGLIISNFPQRFKLKHRLIFGFLLTFFVLTIFGSIKTSPAWLMLLADAKVAVQIDEVTNWRYQGRLDVGYPLNEYGITVNPSNYERIAWALVGFKIAGENLLGYGLMTLSFDGLTKQKWPNSLLSQTHVGLLDFTLGYGVPGFILLVLPLVLAWYFSKSIKGYFSCIGRWGLASMGLVMLSTEISSEIFINALIFMVVMVSGLTINLERAKGYAIPFKG